MDIKEIFSIEQTIAKDLIEKTENIWNCLPKIHDYIIELGKNLNQEIYEQIGGNIWIAKNAKIASTANIIGPAIIDEYAEIRHCAYIRENVIIGKRTVVGNSTELKNCILFNEVEVPHFNYVGDSILGYKAHMGAGSIASNFRLDKQTIKLKIENNVVETNLRKLGAFIGDGAQIGCNSVLNPGTIICKNAIIFPLANVRGEIV